MKKRSLPEGEREALNFPYSRDSILVITVSLCCIFKDDFKIDRNLSPRPERGFYSACEDLRPERRFVIYPGEETYPLNSETVAISPADFTIRALAR